MFVGGLKLPQLTRTTGLYTPGRLAFTEHCSFSIGNCTSTGTAAGVKCDRHLCQKVCSAISSKVLDGVIHLHTAKAMQVQASSRLQAMALELTYLAHFLNVTRQRQGPPLPAHDRGQIGQLITTLISWASRRDRHQTASADSDGAARFGLNYSVHTKIS